MWQKVEGWLVVGRFYTFFLRFFTAEDVVGKTPKKHQAEKEKDSLNGVVIEGRVGKKIIIL